MTPSRPAGPDAPPRASEIAVRCAANLRRLRGAQDLSLSELARRSGVAKGTLSKLEAGAGNPTLDTLWALAGALGVPFADLVAERNDTAFVLRRDGSLLSGRAIDGRVVDRVFGAGVVDVVEVSFREGSPREVAGHSSGSVTRLFILAGTLEVRLPGETIALVARDFIRFDSDRPHAFAAVGGTCDALGIVTFGPASRGNGADPVRIAFEA